MVNGQKIILSGNTKERQRKKREHIKGYLKNEGLIFVFSDAQYTWITDEALCDESLNLVVGNVVYPELLKESKLTRKQLFDMLRSCLEGEEKRPLSGMEAFILSAMIEEALSSDDFFAWMANDKSFDEFIEELKDKKIADVIEGSRDVTKGTYEWLKENLVNNDRFRGMEISLDELNAGGLYIIKWEDDLMRDIFMECIKSCIKTPMAIFLYGNEDIFNLIGKNHYGIDSPNITTWIEVDKLDDFAKLIKDHSNGVTCRLNAIELCGKQEMDNEQAMRLAFGCICTDKFDLTADDILGLKDGERLTLIL